MHKDTEIRNTKQCRKDIDVCLQKVKQLNNSREVSISITKLQEAIMWLGMNLKQLNCDNPYPESYNPNNNIVEPTSDNLKM